MFFIDFGVDFGGLGVIFESLGASLLKVLFERVLGRARGQTEKMGGELVLSGPTSQKHSGL